MNLKIEKFEDGLAICGSCTSEAVLIEIKDHLKDNKFSAIVTDPPYGNIVDEEWDRWNDGQKSFVDWMVNWTNKFSELLVDGGAMYVWGGYGIPGFRPFFEYAHRVEHESVMQIANLITWHKKRAYGVQHNYLSTREEVLYMTKGNIKKPAVFNVPYLEEKRGYSGYNAKYPAKSEFYRRTNVWTDVTEIFSGKVHPTQKPLRVMEIPIESSTNPGQYVFDPFAGSMSTAFAARKLGRNWVCIEKDQATFDEAVNTLRSGTRKR